MRTFVRNSCCKGIQGVIQSKSKHMFGTVLKEGEEDGDTAGESFGADGGTS